jgi:hypothetical protein
MSRRSAGFLVVALAGLNCFFNPPAGPTTRGAPAAPVSFRDVREIELSAVYSTSSQKKLEDVYHGLKEDSPEWKEPYNIGSALADAKSPPLLTVVRGENVREAVVATARFVKSRPSGPVGPDDKSASKKCWLFVYLGHASSTPPEWLIYSPTIFGTRVRFSYTRFEGWFTPDPDEGWDRTADDHSYLYWVPLGEVSDPSELRAELVELVRAVKAIYPAKRK